MPRPLRWPTASAATVALAVTIGALTGCSSPSEPTAVRDELPDGVTVAVVQTRSDIAKRQLEIAVSNESGETVTVTGAEFVSTQFTTAVTWQKASTTISPGRTVNLPVLLADPDCAADGPVAEVRLDLRVGDAEPVAVATEPDDALNRLPALRSEDCLAVAVRAVAQLTVVDPPRVRTVAATSVVDVDISIEPTGSNRSFTIEEALGTTLLAPADPSSGAIVSISPVGTTISGDADGSVLTVAFVPNRCDAHAIAEDKRGTILPLRVTLEDGTSGLVSIESPPAVKSALIDYLTGACAPG